MDESHVVCVIPSGYLSDVGMNSEITTYAQTKHYTLNHITM